MISNVDEGFDTGLPLRGYQSCQVDEVGLAAHDTELPSVTCNPRILPHTHPPRSHKMTFPFAQTQYAAPDPIFELKLAYDADPCKPPAPGMHQVLIAAPDKITLGPGAYQDDKGKAWILPSVAAAEKHMAANPPGHEYLPLLGLPAFREASQKVIFGDNAALLQGPKVASLQTVSGSGAVHVAAEFLKQFYSASATVYVSDPSWSNHRVMFEYVGFAVKDYPYYDASTKGVAFQSMLACFEQANEGDAFVLHPCAHNPTGCDLSQEQWKKIGEVMKRRKLVPILDSAYQGFATGDLDADAWSVRYLLGELGLTGLVCQSFSKSMGLYGERVGALHVVLPENTDAQLIKSIESQLGWISRKEISTPGRYGATIAATIVNTPELYKQWREDMRTMSGRIYSMRKAVVDGLTELGTPGSWKHVTDQIGMFSYTGLTKEQVLKLREKHIYMADSGRASISGLNEGNVGYFCRWVDEIVRTGQ